MTQTVEQAVAAGPIETAKAHRQRDLAALAQAREGLLELVRQRGAAGSGLIDDVATKEGLPPVIVQQALWALLNEQVLITDEYGAVEAGPQSGSV